MASISALLSLQIELNVTDFIAQANRVDDELSKQRRLLQQRGAEIEKSLKDLATVVEKGIRNVLIGFGIQLGFDALRSWFLESMATTAGLGRISQAIGISIEKLGEYRQAFKALGGSATEIDATLLQIRKDITSLNQGLGQADWMRTLQQPPFSMDLERIRRQDPNETLKEISRRAGIIGITPTALANYLKDLPLGITGALILTKPAQLEEQLRKQQELKLAPTTPQAKAAQDFTTALENATSAQEALWRNITSRVSPVLVKLLNLLRRTTVWVNDLINNVFGEEGVESGGGRGAGGGVSGRTDDGGMIGETTFPGGGRVGGFRPSAGGGAGISAPAGTPKKQTGLATVTTSTGKQFQVDARYAANFQGFIDDYEKAGGVIGPESQTLGNRPFNPSGHPIGTAMDINQAGYGIRSRTGKTLPPEVEDQLAAKWGLISGNQWRRPDTGHFGIRSPEAAAAALRPEGPPSPASLLRTPVAPSSPVGSLAVVRAGLARELESNPRLKQDLFDLAEAEVGGQGPNAKKAFIETVFNRAAARRQSLAAAIYDRFYYPGTTTRHIGSGYGPRDEATLQSVIGGSNVSNYATGNASGTVGFAGGPQTYAPGTGERFGREGPDLPWVRRMIDEANKPKVPDVLPGKASSPAVQNNEEMRPRINNTENHVNKVEVHTNATDASGIAQDVKKEVTKELSGAEP